MIISESNVYFGEVSVTITPGAPVSSHMITDRLSVALCYLIQNAPVNKSGHSEGSNSEGFLRHWPVNICPAERYCKRDPL